MRYDGTSAQSNHDSAGTAFTAAKQTFIVVTVIIPVSRRHSSLLMLVRAELTPKLGIKSYAVGGGRNIAIPIDTIVVSLHSLGASHMRARLSPNVIHCPTKLGTLATIAAGSI